MLDAKLRVVGGKHHGKVIPLGTRKFLIGREQDCQLRPNSELVSRHHCVFTVDDFTVRLRDLGSTNGTFVNNERLRGERVLQVGDRVRVGRLDFDIVIGRPEAAEKTNGEADKSATAQELNSETAQLSSSDSDTSFELPVQQAVLEAAAADSDTTVIPPPNADSNPSPPPAQQPAQQQPMPAYPPQHYPPQHMPYQPVGYPQMPYGYPQPPGMGMSGVFPGYPQHPGPYPQAGYYPQQQYYGPAPTPTETAAPDDSHQSAGSVPPVRLPDPTPKKPPEAPKTETASGTPGSQGKQDAAKQPSTDEEGNPSQKAAEIIRNYTHRRPDVS